MNLLLLTERDRVPGLDRFRVDGRRAHHLATVLRAGVGASVRAGLLDGPLARARVTGVTPDCVELEIETWTPAPSTPRDALVLAIPRPKVLSRMLATAAALGFGRIHLTRAWKVEKSHLVSRVLEEPTLGESLCKGLEQARRTRLPAVTVHTRFTGLLDALAEPDVPAARWIAHPGAAAAGGLARGALTLALGPDGGWIDRELESLEGLGFRRFGFGDHPLRTETALGVAWGQLDLLRRQDLEDRNRHAVDQ